MHGSITFMPITPALADLTPSVLLKREAKSCSGAPAVVRVWTREAQLHSLGEAAEGLLPVLAWQPNGRHLYVAQAAPGGAQRVLLFESNGLQHGGWDVRQAGAAGRGMT